MVSHDFVLNFLELAVGNVVRRVLHIIREEEVSVATSAEAELEAGSDSDDNADSDNDGPPGLSAAVLAAANRSLLRAPSLHNLLESVLVPSAAVVPSSSNGDSEGKSRCKLLYHYCTVRLKFCLCLFNVH